MLSRLKRWIETRIDPFAAFDPLETPPGSVGGFMRFYLRDVRWWLALVLVTAAAFSAIEAMIYVFIGWFVDALNTTTPQTLWAEKGWLMLIMAGVLLILRPIAYAANHTVIDQLVVPQLSNQIRWRAHGYVLGHQLSYFHDDFAGRLATRVIQAGQAVRAVAIELIDDMLFVTVFAFTALGLFGTVSLTLMVPVLVWMLAYGALMAYFVPRALERSEATSQGRSMLTGRIVDSYTNIQTVKLFARSEVERRSVKDALAVWLRAFLDLNWLITHVSIVLQTLNSLLMVAVAAIALRLWMHGAMTVGEIAGGLGVTVRLITMSSWVMHEIRGIFENIGTVQESMQTIARPHGLIDRPGAPALIVGKGAIDFDAVRFGYAGNAPLFDGLSLAIRPGEKVGLVGPSGAGKSTLVSLLLRLHDIQGGAIRIDGQDIAAVTQDSLRAQIAVVTQDTALLHRSIRDNIAYGRADAGEEAIRRAARAAEAAPFIDALRDSEGRDSYDARVGERGVKLSGGQRQRIAIARVILKDAPILVLDEATSALDSDVEAAIQSQLTALMGDKTVIAIAHRLSTIAALDRLVVMDHGRIVEQGSHAGLIAAGGLYARLWARQSGGFIGTVV